jgi:hypothetical protein
MLSEIFPRELLQPLQYFLRAAQASGMTLVLGRAEKSARRLRPRGGGPKRARITEYPAAHCRSPHAGACGIRIRVSAAELRPGHHPQGRKGESYGQRRSYGKGADDLRESALPRKRLSATAAQQVVMGQKRSFRLSCLRQRTRVHSGNPALRRPSISSFEFDCPPRAVHSEIVNAGSVSSTRAAASRASASRPRWAKADARQR